MVFICYFQSVAKSASALLLCLLRGCLLIVAFVYILPALLGETGIWLAFPLAELVTMVVGISLYKKYTKRFLKG